METPSDELHHRQEKELQRLANARVKRLLRMLEDARLELQATIANVDADTFTANRVIMLNEQIDQIMEALRRDIRRAGEHASEIASLAKSHLDETVGIITGSSTIKVSFDVLNVDVLRKFSQLTLENVSDLMGVAEKNKIKSVLFTKVGVKGENPAKVARELVGRDSAFTGRYNHVENIIRTETNSVYNAQSLEGIKSLNEAHDLGLAKRIVETIDPKRNHPISVVLNGQVRKPGDKFKASVSAVQSAGARMGKKGRVNGVLWPIVNGYYVGDRLPAHYFERGIVVPTTKPLTKD